MCRTAKTMGPEQQPIRLSPGPETEKYVTESHTMTDEERRLLPPNFKFPSQKIDFWSLTPYTDATQCKKVSNHVKRPMNAFMVWSQIRRSIIASETPEMHNAEISKLLGKCWKKLDENMQKLFKRESDVLKVLHQSEYPDYKYKPKKKKTSAAAKGVAEGRVTKAPRRREPKAKGRAASKAAASPVFQDSAVATSLLAPLSSPAARATTMEEVQDRLTTKLTINGDGSGKVDVYRKPSTSAEVPSPSSAYPATPDSHTFYDENSAGNTFQHQAPPFSLPEPAESFATDSFADIDPAEEFSLDTIQETIQLDLDIFDVSPGQGPAMIQETDSLANGYLPQLSLAPSVYDSPLTAVLSQENFQLFEGRINLEPTFAGSSYDALWSSNASQL